MKRILFPCFLILNITISAQTVLPNNNYNLNVKVEKDYSYDIAYNKGKSKQLQIEIAQKIQFTYEDMLKYMKESYDGASQLNEGEARQEYNRLLQFANEYYNLRNLIGTDELTPTLYQRRINVWLDEYKKSISPNGNFHNIVVKALEKSRNESNYSNTNTSSNTTSITGIKSPDFIYKDSNNEREQKEIVSKNWTELYSFVYNLQNSPKTRGFFYEELSKIQQKGKDIYDKYILEPKYTNDYRYEFDKLINELVQIDTKIRQYLK